MADKTCEDCGEQREDTPLNFPVHKKRRQKCLSCVVKIRRRKADAKAEHRARKMQQLENAAVDEMLKAARRGGTDIPHSAELLEQVMHCFGGVNGFSNLLMKNYFDSKPGSPQRTKIMEMITRLVTFWSEEELNAELDARLQQAVEQYMPARQLPGVPRMEVDIAALAEHPGNE
jgi:hypothetical protein